MERFYGLDLRDEVDRAGPRKLWVRICGLPPDAATWRHDRLPPAEEYAALAVERQDAWMRALLDASLGAKRVKVPGPVRIDRPGVERSPEGRVVKTLGELEGWMARNTPVKKRKRRG